MKNLNLKLLVSTVVFIGTVTAQPVIFSPRGTPPLPSLEPIANVWRELPPAPLPDDLLALEAPLAELSLSMEDLNLMELDLLKVDMELSEELPLIFDFGFELSGNFGALGELFVVDEGSPQQDPGYKAYKDGYNLVLQEKWADARKKLGELAKKYPNSRYVDDAQYWVAFSYMQERKRAKASELYRAFLKAYPMSNYFDDAVADLGKLDGKAAADSARSARAAYEARILAVAPQKNVVISAEPIDMYLNQTEPVIITYEEDDKENSELRMKKNAIEALRNHPDERSFNTIREISVDPGQPKELRLSALSALEKFDRKMALPVYLEVLQGDENVQVRKRALYSISQLARQNDERAFYELKKFATDSKQLVDLRESALSYMKSVKSPEVLDLYLRVLKSDTNEQLRKSALYNTAQLTKDNEERVASIMKEYALDRTQERGVRETALRSLHQTMGSGALTIYLEVLKNDSDDRVRRLALYYVGRMAKENDEQAFRILKDYAADRKQSADLREMALQSLRELRRPDVLPMLIDIAKNDPDEKVRTSAIYQIGKMEMNGTNASKFLIDLAKDQTQSKNVRKSAFYALRDFTGVDLLNFYANIAKNDPDREIQQSAIYHISHSSKDKMESMEFLVKLYGQLPADRVYALESCLYSIANIGGDKAVDFLIKVAKTDTNTKMREKAVYYLGNVGGDKARTALLEILQGK